MEEKKEEEKIQIGLRMTQEEIDKAVEKTGIDRPATAMTILIKKALKE